MIHFPFNGFVVGRKGTKKIHETKCTKIKSNKASIYYYFSTKKRERKCYDSRSGFFPAPVWDFINSDGNEMSNQELKCGSIHIHIQTFWQHLIKRVRMAAGYVVLPIFALKFNLVVMQTVLIVITGGRNVFVCMDE